MTDPVSLSATAIATLAFTKACEKTVENFTQATWNKIEQLRQTIWLKLRHRFQAESVLNAAAQGSDSDLEQVAEYLDVVMNEDSEFAAEVRLLARQINAVKVQNDNSSMNIDSDNNSPSFQTTGNTGNVNLGSDMYVAKGDKVYIGKEINIQESAS
ncbi:MAG: hypothetical protein F6J86_01205 [Symploca sp. SIO1B1]|nr:hypothetical protein [Symploca sp. SIO1B1]